jgi:uncharacterized membrane protein YeaQ/YmgE (transglycosylase-associated protein family)
MGGLIGTIVGGVVIGAVIGGLARLVLPGKQDISMIMTIGIGLAGAIAGGLLAGLFGVRETSGVDWIKLVFQVGFAAAGVVLYERFRSARSSELKPGKEASQ